MKHETTDKEELKHRVEELGRDIEFLKQTFESMTKRQWGEVFLVQLRKWKDRVSLKQIAAGTRVFKSLLPADMSDELDTFADTVEGIAEVIEKPPAPNVRS